MFDTSNNLLKSNRKSLYSDFQKRYWQYSKLWFLNSKWLDKTTVEWQVPAFWIRLFSDAAIAHLKRFPDIYNELKKISLVFQYIKYRPKKAAMEYMSKQLDLARNNYAKQKALAQRKWISTTGWKAPTRETLWLKQAFEKFKETYPKIQVRKADTTIDVIKSDWTWYLITFINHPLEDGQIVWQDFFFKNPATIKKTIKTELDETLFKRVNKIFSEIEAIVLQFEIGVSDDMYENYKENIIYYAKSLTREGLDETFAKRQNKEQEKELKKKLLIWDSLEWLWFNEFTAKREELENNSWSSFYKEDNIWWDSFDSNESFTSKVSVDKTTIEEKTPTSESQVKKTGWFFSSLFGIKKNTSSETKKKVVKEEPQVQKPSFKYVSDDSGWD